MLNPEVIVVEAGGLAYGGFESVKVTASIKEAVRSFTLLTTERPGEWNFQPGTPIAITANGDLLVDGYVNEYAPSGDAKSHKISITGRGKGQDFVDSSADHKTGEWDNADPEQVAKDLAKPHGTIIAAKAKLKKVERWALSQGETAFQSVERMIRPQGVTMMGNADGSIDITNAQAAKYAFGMLAEGWNIESYSGKLSDQNRHKTTKCKGQRRLGSSDDDLAIEETATDSGGARNRTKIIVNETDTDKKRARERATHDKERQAGKSVSCSITTQGFRDFAGKLFEPNSILYVHAPILLKISQPMLIESLEFAQDDRSGSLTNLKLVDPRAYKGKAGGGGATGPDGGALEGETDTSWTDGY